MATATLTPSSAWEFLSSYRANPVAFSRDILGADPWSACEDIMRALAQPHARVAVRACHGSAKTWVAAQLVLWWLSTGGIAITTAAKFTQVKKLLWLEIHKAYGKALLPIGGQLNDTELRIAPDCYALGMSTNDETRFQGWHAPRLLFVLDEAPGIAPGIYRAIKGSRAGGDVRQLVLGNPIPPGGPYQDCFTVQRAGWTTFRVDAFDTPNLEGVALAEDGVDGPGRTKELTELTEEELDWAPRPYLTTRRWVLECYTDFGTRSPYWQAKVRGEFPEQAEDALLALGWLEKARQSELNSADDERAFAGIDVAGPGEDETVACVRVGPRIVAMQAWASADPKGAVAAFLAPWKDRLDQVNVDSVGIGWYFARHLEDLDFPVTDVNAGDAANDREKFANLKAELYWGFRERCEQGLVAGLDDELAISQLSTIRYQHKPSGQIAIEKKDDARKRGLKSPDRAEAIILAFAAEQHDSGMSFAEY